MDDGPSLDLNNIVALMKPKLYRNLSLSTKISSCEYGKNSSQISYPTYHLEHLAKTV